MVSRFHIYMYLPHYLWYLLVVVFLLFQTVILLTLFAILAIPLDVKIHFWIVKDIIFQNLLNFFIMSKKDILILILKIVIYGCTLALGVLGVSAMASCSASRDVDVVGKTTIVTTDTTYIHHNTFIKYPKR